MRDPGEGRPLDLVAWVDGAARGNPGPASWGAVLEDGEGHRVAELAAPIGTATNNVAEYRGLLAALEYAVARGARSLEVRTDSLLVANQMNGTYKVRHPGLLPLHEKARRLASRIGSFRIVHVARESNPDADRLANRALDGVSQGNPDA